MSDGITEARRGFASYINRQFDEFTSKAKYPAVILKIFMREEDFTLFQKHIEKIKDDPKNIGIGDYVFEYVSTYDEEPISSYYTSKFYVELKLGGGIFTYNFKENMESVRDYIFSNDFHFGADVCCFKILSIERTQLEEDIIRNEIKSNTEKTYIFRVKVDPHHTYKDIKCDQDGIIFIITDNPSTIYSRIRVEDVISIEKISVGYIFK